MSNEELNSPDNGHNLHSDQNSEMDTLIQGVTLEIEKKKAELEEIALDARAKLREVDTSADEMSQRVSALANTASERLTELEKCADSAREAATFIGETKSDIQMLRTSTRAASTKLENQHTTIDATIAQLLQKTGALADVSAKLENAVSEADAALNAARENATNTEESKNRFLDLLTQTEENFSSLEQRQNDLTKKLEEIEGAYGQVLEFQRTLFSGSETEQSTEDTIGDLVEKLQTTASGAESDKQFARERNETLIADFRRDLETMKSETSRNFQKLHGSLEAQILSLLPSAGAAGLASTYYEAKSRYAPTAYVNREAGYSLFGWRVPGRRLLSSNPLSLFSTIFFYALFIVPLLAIAYGTYELVRAMEISSNFTLDYKVLILRILAAVPLATLSYFGFTSLRLYRKLYEEYNHKQRVMELYRSFKDEIEENGDEEQAKALLTIMLNSVSSKAWETTERDIKLPAPAESSNPLAIVEQVVDLATKLKSTVA